MEKSEGLFWKELPKILLLIGLYTLQGLCAGFFMISVPIIFKKYLTYSELSVIMMCTAPFTFKVFWSPVVEFFYNQKFGRRKSWIVPTQLVIVAMIYYLKDNLEQLLMDKHVFTVAALLTSIIFVITC